MQYTNFLNTFQKIKMIFTLAILYLYNLTLCSNQCSTEVLSSLCTIPWSLSMLMQNQRDPQMCHFTKQSIDITKPIGTASDPTLQKHLSQLSLKMDLAGCPPLFLILDSLQHWKLYPSQKYINRSLCLLWPWLTVIITTIFIKGNGVAEPLHRDHELCIITARVLENAKSSYVQTVQDKVDNKNLGSHEFWKIANAP